MEDSTQTQMTAIQALTKELDQNVRTLKRLLAGDQEQADKSNEEDPEALVSQLYHK